MIYYRLKTKIYNVVRLNLLIAKSNHPLLFCCESLDRILRVFFSCTWRLRVLDSPLVSDLLLCGRVDNLHRASSQRVARRSPRLWGATLTGRQLTSSVRSPLGIFPHDSTQEEHFLLAHQSRTPRCLFGVWPSCCVDVKSFWEDFWRFTRVYIG